MCELLLHLCVCICNAWATKGLLRMLAFTILGLTVVGLCIYGYVSMETTSDL